MAFVLFPVGIAYLTYKINEGLDSIGKIGIKFLQWKDEVVDNLKSKLNKKNQEKQEKRREDIRNKRMEIKNKYKL